MNKSIDVKVKDLVINNNNQFTLIAGPCVIESKDHALRTAEELSKICSSLGLQFIYKSSFDKANRTFLNSSRGPGIMESLEIVSLIEENISKDSIMPGPLEELRDVLLALSNDDL